jgi:membrane protein YqaA with SNARE-associated domain
MNIVPAKVVNAKVASQAKFLAAASIWATLRRWGGPGLFLIGIIDSSFIPTLGSLDIFNAVLSAHHHDLWWYYAMMSTAGSVAGAYLMYRLASSAGTGWLQKRMGAARVARVDRILEKYGATAVVIAVIAPPPFPTSPFFVAAGALKFPLRKYLIAVITGRAFRYSLVAWIASHYSRGIIRVLRHPQQYAPVTISITLALVLVAVAAGLVWHRIGQEIERAQLEAQHKQQVPSC